MEIVICIDDTHPEKGWGMPDDECTLYLHKLKDKLDMMLLREKRTKLAKACFDFIQYRTDLDINGWSEQDIFKH